MAEEYSDTVIHKYKIREIMKKKLSNLCFPKSLVNII